MSKLSVVVPIYNVEEYVGAALESLSAQTCTDLEVIMVDDGSTDHSGEIAAEFATDDPRFRLVVQPNGGLSRARNAGVRHATGDYLTFVDSDDLVPHYAYATAVRTLEHTGSDFLTGKVLRFDDRGAFEVPMQRRSHRRDLLRTTVTESPELMRDFLPHNKVYRRSFWDSAGLSFPDGLTFEDGPVSVRAHALAKAVDVLCAPTYYWRLRDGAAPSISRQRTAEHFYTDRVATSAISVDCLREMRPDLLDVFHAADIRHKFGIMYASLADASPRVQRLFLDEAVPYLAQVSPAVIDELPEPLRERVRLTARGDLPALLDGLAGPGDPDPEDPGPDVARPAGLLGRSSLLRAARAYLGQDAASATAVGEVSRLSVHDGVLRLSGFGHFTGLPAEGPLTAGNRSILACHAGSGTQVRLGFRATASPEAAAAQPEDAAWSARHAGYEATLDLARLKKPNGQWRHGVWRLEMVTVTPRGAHRAGLRAGSPQAPRPLRPVDLDDETRVVPSIKDGCLVLRLHRTEGRLTGHRLEDGPDGGTLVLTGVVRGALTSAARLRLCRTPQVPELTVPVEVAPGPEWGTAVTARLPVAAVLAAFGPVRPAPVAGVPNRLLLEVAEPGDDGRGVHTDMSVPALTARHDGQRVELASDGKGRTVLTLRPVLPTVEHASWRPDGTLQLSGTDGGSVPAPRLLIRHTQLKEERVLPMEVEADGAWRARLHPGRAPRVGGDAALRAGRWRFALRTRDEHGDILDVDLPHEPALADRIAADDPADRCHLRVSGLDRLTLRVRTRLDDDERGPFNQRRLRETDYPRMTRRLPLRDVILYCCSEGRQYTGSPRALHELLAARGDGPAHLWATADAQAAVPEGTATVEVGGHDWYEALATSRYVVVDGPLPPWFRRRDGQVVAQTWHAAGIGRPAPLSGSAQWSLLLSPDAGRTPLLRDAFGYQGEVCEFGSPHNDPLVVGDRDAAVARVRRDLGLPADRRIVLYAPTRRDNDRRVGGRQAFDLRLDVACFPEEVRRDHVLLVRRHPDSVHDLLGLPEDGFVRDVGAHPDVSLLLQAADALVTDYSSIALDFAVTGRPILFYAYDLDDHRDRTGLELDLDAEGPGPVLRTGDQVVTALAHLDAVAELHRERYAAFRARFCAAEDGRATERFAARLLRDR